MLIKFFGGTGGGGSIANYLVDPERAGREEAAPEVLRGDITQTRELIDSSDRKWTYSTGVLSFAPEDRPTEAQQKALMNDFERLAFAGLNADQYDITWVRHSHTKGGRVELHFLTPRMELASGKAFNIAPPGWERSYAPLRDAYNYAHGWARPDDPARERSQHQTTERSNRATDRAGINSYIEGGIITGQIYNRDGVVAALYEAGFDTPRLGKSYITALNPETGERWRLKGGIYEQNWTRNAELNRPTATERQTATADGRGCDPERAADARDRLEAVIERRAGWVKDHYHIPDESDRDRNHREADPDRKGVEGDQAQAMADADDQRRVSDTDQRDVLDRSDAVDDVAHERGEGGSNRDRDVLGPARDGTDGMDLQQYTVREAGGLANEQSHPDRASALARIRELGSRVRGFGSAAVAAVRAFFSKDHGADNQAEPTRDPVAESERSLSQADRVNGRLDREGAALEQRLEMIERIEQQQKEIELVLERARQHEITR